MIAALLASRLTFHQKEVAPTEQSIWEDVRSGLFYLKRQRVLWTVAVLAAFLNFFFVATEVLFPIATLQEVGVSPFQFGLLESMVAIGFLVASLLHALPLFKIKNRLATMRSALTILSVLFVGPAIPLYLNLNVLTSIFFFAMFALLSGFFIVRVNVPVQLLLQTNTDPNYLGRVIGVLESLAMGITPIGFILFGVLGDLVPVAHLYTACMIGLLLCTFTLTYRIRHDIQAERAAAQSIERVS